MDAKSEKWQEYTGEREEISVGVQELSVNSLRYRSRARSVSDTPS